MPNRSVRFAENPQVLPVDQFETEDGVNINEVCWHSSSEIRRMAWLFAAIVRFFRGQAINNGQQDLMEIHFLPEELTTTHGVETLIRDTQNVQSLMRDAHFSAVMNEQQRQYNLQHTDANALAAISIHHSGRAADRARGIGLKHYHERE